MNKEKYKIEPRKSFFKYTDKCEKEMHTKIYSAAGLKGHWMFSVFLN